MLKKNFLTENMGKIKYKYPDSKQMEFLTKLHEFISTQSRSTATCVTEPFIQTLSSLAVSQTLVQTSTPTAPQKKRSCTRLSVLKSSSLTASSPATLCCPLRLSWVTASTTCASTMACRRRSVTTWRRTLRPVRVPESPSAGGTAPSAVSYSNCGWQLKRRRDCSFCLSYFILSPPAALPCPPNSHYSDCTSPCPATCSDLFPIFCHLPSTTCVEGCQCDAGYVLSDNNCVRLDKCGCSDSDGEYHDVSEAKSVLLLAHDTNKGVVSEALITYNSRPTL